MRILGEKVIPEIAFSDPVSGSELSFFYRVPTTDERKTYLASMFKRVDEVMEDHSYDTRVKYAKKILTGIGEGQFGFEVEDEEDGSKVIQISSDPNNEHYRADWKELIEQYLPDMLWFLSFRIFEGASVTNNKVTDRTFRGNEAYDSKN